MLFIAETTTESYQQRSLASHNNLSDYPSSDSMSVQSSASYQSSNSGFIDVSRDTSVSHSRSGSIVAETKDLECNSSAKCMDSNFAVSFSICCFRSIIWFQKSIN